MSDYPIFREIINDITARPEADPVGILEEYIAPLVDLCNEINQWIGENKEFDLRNEPPWYQEFIRNLARYDVDLSPIWQEARNEAAQS